MCWRQPRSHAHSSTTREEVRRANNNSLYDAERNSPAGEMVCKSPTTSDYFLFKGETSDGRRRAPLLREVGQVDGREGVIIGLR